MKNFVWILKSFGVVASVVFLWHSLLREVGRLFRRERIKRFEDLTDEEAYQTARAFGIYKWYDREDLNQTWKEFDGRTLH